MFSPVTRFSNLLKTRPSTILSAYLLASIVTAPAYAQRCSQPEGFTPPANARPGVRYRTGRTETRGWERDLVHRDASLGHWNWAPMASYHQWIPKATSKQAICIATPRAMPQTSHYAKPIHAAMPLSEQQLWELKGRVNPGSANENVSGSLSQGTRSSENTSGRINRPQILSYGSGYGHVTAYDAEAVRSEVYGQIRSH
jgi:hypothetical protein